MIINNFSFLYDTEYADKLLHLGVLLDNNEVCGRSVQPLRPPPLRKTIMMQVTTVRIINYSALFSVRRARLVEMAKQREIHSLNSIWMNVCNDSEKLTAFFLNLY